MNIDFYTKIEPEYIVDVQRLVIHHNGVYYNIIPLGNGAIEIKSSLAVAIVPRGEKHIILTGLEDKTDNKD